MSFSAELKKAMERENISASELAEKTGICKSSLSQYLSGKAEPKASAIKKISGVINVNYDFKNVPVSIAADMLGKSEQFIRIGLQQGILPFGKAVKLSSKYSYHISQKLLEEYIGSLKVTS